MHVCAAYSAVTPRIKALRRSALDIDPKATERLRRPTRSILEANAGEASMIARCADKTRLYNIEPEDPRAVTPAATFATASH